MGDLIPLIFTFLPNRALLYVSKRAINDIKSLGDKYFADILSYEEFDRQLVKK